MLNTRAIAFDRIPQSNCCWISLFWNCARTTQSQKMPKVIGEKKSRIHNDIQKQGNACAHSQFRHERKSHSPNRFHCLQHCIAFQVLFSTRISVSTFWKIRSSLRACWKSLHFGRPMWCWKLVRVRAIWRWKCWKKRKKWSPVKLMRGLWPSYKSVSKAHRTNRNYRFSSVMRWKQNFPFSTFALQTFRTKSVHRWYSNCCSIGRFSDVPYWCFSVSSHSGWWPSRATNYTVAWAWTRNCWPVSICWWKLAEIISNHHQKLNRPLYASNHEIHRRKSISPNGMGSHESHFYGKIKRWPPHSNIHRFCKRWKTTTNYRRRYRIRCAWILTSIFIFID